jgi:hypothetical protein
MDGDAQWESPSLRVVVRDVSENLDVLCARTLRALTLDERDTLSRSEVFEANTFDSGHVEEEILPLAGLDEPKALVRQSFDGSFSHAIQPFTSGFVCDRLRALLERR